MPYTFKNYLTTEKLRVFVFVFVLQFYGIRFFCGNPSVQRGGTEYITKGETQRAQSQEWLLDRRAEQRGTSWFVCQAHLPANLQGFTTMHRAGVMPRPSMTISSALWPQV